MQPKSQKDCNEQDCVDNNNKKIDDGLVVFVVVDFLFWLLLFITDHYIDTLSYFFFFPVGFKRFYAAGNQSDNWDEWESPYGDCIEVTYSSWKTQISCE